MRLGDVEVVTELGYFLAEAFGFGQFGSIMSDGRQAGFLELKYCFFIQYITLN